MGFFLKAICVGVVAAGIKKIMKNVDEENRRKNSVCHFDGDIMREEFYVMVKRGSKGIKRLTNLYADGPIAHGTVRSQSGISDWCFTIDFNDYGDVTGKYWIYTDNDDSNIPKIVAERIAEQIKNHPDCVDDSFDDEVCEEEIRKEIREEANAFCPYCGKKISGLDAKFCTYCGKRFRV